MIHEDFIDCPFPCQTLGYCTRKSFLAIDRGEVMKAGLVMAVRTDAFDITQRKGVYPAAAREWLNDEYRDATLEVINRNGVEVDLMMECYEATDEQIDNGTAEIWEEALREFFRTNACSQPQIAGHVFVTEKWHRQFATMASVIGVSYPEKSRWWPRIIDGEYVDPRVANTNAAPNTD